MHFELSEKEFHSLESCQQQIGFMSDLCVHVEGAQSVSIVGLMHFLDAQKKALGAIIQTAEERQDAQIACNREAANNPVQQPSAGLETGLLIRLMEVCSGVQLSEDAVMRLYDDLYDATVPEGQGELLKAFHGALLRLGYQVSYTQNEQGSQFAIRLPTAKAKTPTAAKPKAPARKRERLIQA